MIRGWNRRWLMLGAIVAVLLACAGVAYAVTAADFQPRAEEWQGSTCNEALLKAKASAANNQKIATCYAVAKVKEQQATISSLQTSVAKLESTQMPPPLDFTFFNGGPLGSGGTSPILDASKYKTLTLTTRASGMSLSLEVSNDQSVWTVAYTITATTQSEPFSITGHYYRITATGEKGSVTAFAHLVAN